MDLMASPSVYCQKHTNTDANIHIHRSIHTYIHIHTYIGIIPAQIRSLLFLYMTIAIWGAAAVEKHIARDITAKMKHASDPFK